MAAPWLLGTALLALAPPARAQSCSSGVGWISRPVFTGSAGSDIPVSVALRAWGPTDEVFLVYERRFPTQTDMPHKLYLTGYQCPDSVCASNALVPYLPQQVSSTIYHDQYAHPAVAIDVSSGNVRKVSILYRDRATTGCDGDNVAFLDELPSDPEAKRLDLVEAEWYSNGAT
jgi:hypothetical protein